MLARSALIRQRGCLCSIPVAPLHGGLSRFSCLSHYVSLRFCDCSQFPFAAFDSYRLIFPWKVDIEGVTQEITKVGTLILQILEGMEIKELQGHISRTP